MLGKPTAAEPLNDTDRLRAAPAASWGAILAGAVVAVSGSLILLTLGAGLGFASVSPWSGHGVSAGAFTVASTIWLIVTQWVSAALGGYIAGRLRQRWLATHTHEVFFRDTAHGLVTWGVATLFVAAVFAGSMASLVGAGSHAVGGIAAAVSQGSGGSMRSEPPEVRGGMAPDEGAGAAGAYNLDKLFRGNSSDTAPADISSDGRKPPGDARAEVMHIVANAATSGAVSDEDRAYLARLVASKTGISAGDATTRVDTFIQDVKQASDQAKSAADKARKSAATAALFTALALLIGAFIASVSAALGGRLRDEHL